MATEREVDILLERIQSQDFARIVSDFLLKPSPVEAAYHHMEGIKCGQRLQTAVQEALIKALSG